MRAFRTVSIVVVTVSVLSSMIYAYGLDENKDGVATTQHNMFRNLTINDPSDKKEPCMWCHIPHDRYVGDNPPAWSRDSGDNFAIYGVQDESDYDYEHRPDTIVRVCLTCHDGVNAPNIVISNDSKAQEHTKEATLLGAPVAYNTHQHPVGKDYAPNSVNGRKASLKPQSSSLVGWTGANSVGELVPEGVIRCTSCHDPHTTTALFLRIENRRSQLCLGCHGK